MSLHYHIGKTNVVDDALIRLSIGSLAHMDEDKWELVKDIHHLSNLGVCLTVSGDGDVFVHLVSLLSLVIEKMEKQILDLNLIRIKSNMFSKRLCTLRVVVMVY